MEITLLNGKPVKQVSNSLYTGFVADPSIKITTIDKPTFKWRGAKIPFPLWAQIVSFMRWTQEEFKSEALITLMYNAKNATWAAWPFPQETNGMTVKALEDHPLYKDDRAMFKKDWVQAGSIHHHCTADAFASCTDEQDECNRDGVHITLGKMENTDLDYHIRQVFDGIVTTPVLSDWIDDPEWCNTIPMPLKLDVAHWSRTCVRQIPFPDEWKKRVMKPNFQKPTTHTIIGAVSTKSSEDTKGRDKGRRHVDEKTVEGWQTQWKREQSEKLMTVCAQLGISISEAATLLSEYPNPSWDVADIELRRALTAELLKNGFPLLYLENIIEDLT